MLRQLHKTNPVASATTAVTVEQVLAGMDVKGGARFRVQGTQPHPLWAGASAARGPVVWLQVLPQRQALLEPFQILFPGACFPLRVKLRRKAPVFPGKDGGRRDFLR